MTSEKSPETGLPLIPQDEGDAAASKTRMFIPVGMTIFSGIGFGIASAIHVYGSNDVYNKRIDLLRGFDMQYAFLSAFLYGILTNFLNMYCMIFKAKIMRGTDKNFRSNMFIYRLAAEGASQSVVILQEDGDVGMYNRANRSLMHFIENGSPMILALILNSFVYPMPTFVIFVIYFLGCIVYAIGYTNSGYGGQ